MVYQPLLVSIATPSLNRGAYIEQTILSVRRQSYPRVEHIVVDGGSTDATRDILRRHEGAYEMRWVSEPDGGMYGAAPYFRYTAKGSDK